MTYVDDIVSQPQSLERVLDARLGADAERLLDGGGARFDRIVISGMGASAHAAYPAFLRLADAGVPVVLLETAELLQQALGMIGGERTLLWLISQSGDSAEIAALLDQLPRGGPTVLGVVNDTDSALGRGADVIVEMHAGPELAVGTRSFVNTLAVCALVTDRLVGGSSEPELRAAVAPLDAYVGSWREHADAIGAAVGGAQSLFVLGRGSSLAAARTGALVIKEAAKAPAEAMSSSEFRHGPLELVDGGFAAVVLEGDPRTVELNARLAGDIAGHGGRVGWLGRSDGPGEKLALAPAEGAALAIAETVPLQLLSVVLAERAGIEPGVFRYLQKVTRTL